MFTQPVPAPSPAPSSPGLSSAVSSASPASPTRTSRLRGLSYLRSYTQSHLLNRDHPVGAGGGGGFNSSTAATTGSTSPTEPYPLHPTRSVPIPTLHGSNNGSHNHNNSNNSGNNTNSSNNHHRFSLVSVPILTHPLGASPPAAGTSSSPTTEAFPAFDTSDIDADVPRPTAAVPTTAVTTATVAATTTAADRMARVRATTDPSISAGVNGEGAATTSTAGATAGATAGTTTTTTDASTPNVESLPSIRFSTFFDPRSTRQSLKFAPMSRTLPTGKEVIRVGRYSERDSAPTGHPNAPSAAHVGFKSKVVSRRHCEFWFEGGRWFIKDVKSSSGTFLNHIRLSQPGTESKPFPINDGDIVQLGIDFKGGEEMMFRCVKMRVELNRGWQNKLNAFNVGAHKRLRNMTKTEGDGSAQSTQDCSICLNSIAPCQSLFVAPCSHTWHYKCIRSLLESAQYPNFICPNCRAAVDLEADVEDPPEEWEKMEIEEALDESVVAAVSDTPQQQQQQQQQQQSSGLTTSATVAAISDAIIPMEINHTPSPPTTPAPAPPVSVPVSSSHATSSPMAIPQQQTPSGTGTRPGSTTSSAISPAVNIMNNMNINDHSDSSMRTPSPAQQLQHQQQQQLQQQLPHQQQQQGHHPHGIAIPGHEGPITPRNDAGPWVFDGSGIRIGSGGRASTDSRRGEMRSLDTAAAEFSHGV